MLAGALVRKQLFMVTIHVSCIPGVSNVLYSCCQVQLHELFDYPHLITFSEWHGSGNLLVRSI